MTKAVPHQGGAPVGHVVGSETVEAGTVICLRPWCDRPESRSQARKGLALALGARCGHEAPSRLETLRDHCVRRARRPLMRHRAACRPLGADGSCLASFIGFASEDAQEDALVIAATIVTPGMAHALAGLAQEFGPALRRMAIKANRQPEIPKPLH